MILIVTVAIEITNEAYILILVSCVSVYH